MILSIYHMKFNQYAELDLINNEDNTDTILNSFQFNNAFTNISFSYYLYRMVKRKT